MNENLAGAPVHVVGATGRSGLALCRALQARGAVIVPVVRNAAKWRASGLPGTAQVADLHDADALECALGGAELLVSCAHARHAQAILTASPASARTILLGSTRRFTRWPDRHGRGVIDGETAFLASGRRGVMLHPTMIYGAEGENNVQRLLRLLRRLPLVPLPGGGAALVQPIHQADVTRSIIASLAIDWPGPRAIVIAGAAPLPYADFVRAVAFAAKLPPPRIVPLPAAILIGLAPFTRIMPMLPSIGAAEIRRLVEDKAFSVTDMVRTLGVQPVDITEGLATFL